MVRRREARTRVNLRSFFLDHQKQMAAKLAAGFTHLTHPTAKGDASESAWLKLLSEYLPVRYQAMKAFVLDHEGTVSEQIDVVIFDRQYSPFLLVHEGAHYVPAESVYCVFEVRPSLTLGTLRYAGQKVASVRSLKRTSAPVPYVRGVYQPKELYRILGGIMTLNSSLKAEVTLRKGLCDLRGDASLDLGCVLRGQSFSVRTLGTRTKKQQIDISTQSESLIFFFLRLLESLQHLGTAPAINISAYSGSLRSR